jgi:hypothetical protein
MPDFTFDDLARILRANFGGVKLMADDGGPVQKYVLLSDIIDEAVSQSGGGGTPSLPALVTPILSVSVLSSSSLRVNITNIASILSEVGIRIEQSPNGASGWVLVNTVSPDTAFLDVAGLSPSTTYYFRARANANPATNIDSAFSLVANGVTGAAGPSLVDLTFAAANVGLTSASGVWDGSNAATDWANKGLDAKKIAAGTDGFIQVQYVSGATGCVIGFNTTNANDDYTGYEFALYLTPATTYIFFGGSLGAYAGPTVGHFYRVARIGSSIKVQSSPTGGAGGTWTDIHAFGSPSSADLFIGMSIDEKNGDGKCYYPKVYNGV